MHTFRFEHLGAAVIFTGFVLIGLSACRSRAEAGLSPGGGAGSQTVAVLRLKPPPVNSRGQESTYCEWGAFNEGAMNLKLEESGVERSCYGVICDSVFTSLEHGLTVVPSTVDLWFPYLLGKTARSNESRLGLSIPKRWDIRFNKGENLHIRHVINPMDCPVKSAAEVHITQTATVIRDAKGRLLLLSAPDVPLIDKGQALLVPDFVPEVAVSWTDLSCPAYQGPGVGSSGGGHRTVGIVIQATEGGAKAVATWGRNTRLEVGGETYVFSVNQGWFHADGLGCGRAAFTLYKQGYLKSI